MEKVKDLAEAGFHFGAYAGSKKLVDGGYYNPSCYLEYRPKKGGAIQGDDLIDWNGFALNNYGSACIVGVYLPTMSKEKLKTLIELISPR